MTNYIQLFIALFIYITPLNYPSYKHGTSKHYGACLTPRCSKRNR